MSGRDPKLITPDWRERFAQLEQQGRMRDAEAILESNIDHLGVEASLAELWHRRISFHKAANDKKRATAAYHRACMHAFFYAAGATSGGEGAALSLQRDQMIGEFKRTLGFDPGEDPGYKQADAALDNA